MKKIISIMIFSVILLAACTQTNTLDNAVVTYRTYGGFTPVDQAEYLFTINKTHSVLTVLDYKGETTARFEKRINEDVYRQLVDLMQRNDFRQMKDLYERQPGQPDVVDLGNMDITLNDSNFEKTVSVKPMLEDYMPKGLVEIKRYINQVLETTIGDNTIGGNNNAGKDETFTFQPMQCEKTPWEKWYEEGNVQFIKEPTEKELAVAYFGSNNIEVSDFKKVESGNMACEACSVCPTSYYYTVKSVQGEKLKKIGFK